MAGFNEAILMGNLARDPDIRYTQSGIPVANMTLAVNRPPKKGEQESTCDFFPIVAWDKRAEICEKYLRKGSKILVKGEIQNRQYEAKDGTKRQITEIIADQIRFCGNATESRNMQGNEAPGIRPDPRSYTQRQKAPEFNAKPDVFPMDISNMDSGPQVGKDEPDIPF